MVKIGMLIADRYEILEKTGTGGMSVVYRAKDHKLNRIVAVKVLKQEFSDNANFVSKFRVEAQAAAGLMHPNIVNVYDVGEEKGMHYIVMEYVDGITLKKYIEMKSRLSVKETISIAIQVSMGLQAAHQHHVIHRDIKPQNIMISKDGKVKVTDFGIAKAATSNTITSNVMGSVHYTSPEQARGGYSDERSDIYSLGITMFEMLTGRVPFNGETTVAIAIKHIQQPMPSPREFVPDIPRSVEQIVLKCCEKSPDRRYQNMGELIADLKQALIHPDDDFVKVINPDEESATRMAAPVEQAQIRRRTGNTGHIPTDELPYGDAVSGAASRGTGYRTDGDRYGDRYGSYADGYADSSAQGREGGNRGTARDADYRSRDDGYYETSGPRGDGYSDSYDNDRSGRNSGRESRRGGYDSREETASRRNDYREPDYRESDYRDSGRRGSRNERLDEPLRKNTRRSRYDSGYDDYDSRYDPRKERRVTALAVIVAILIGVVIIVFAANRLGLLAIGTGSTESATSATTEGVTLPTMVGENAETLKTTLNSLGLIPEVTYEESDQYDSDVVMSAALSDGTAVNAGDVVEPGTNIVLTVSAGKSGVEVPDVSGMTRAEAAATLRRAGFDSINWAEGVSNDVEKGQVISQDPAAGTVAPTESTLTVTICTGADTSEQIQVPDVTGLSLDDAKTTLTDNNLTVGTTTESETDDPNKVGIVISQSVEANTYVDAETSVNLTVGKAAEQQETATTTYYYNADIQAPTAEEAPDYVPGTAVYVVFMAADGQTLLNSTYTSFPIPTGFTGLSSSSGTIQMSYPSSAEGAVDGQRVITRSVTFTPEGQ